MARDRSCDGQSFGLCSNSSYRCGPQIVDEAVDAVWDWAVLPRSRSVPSGLGWGGYTRILDEEQHEVGKYYTQKIERKCLTLRTRIKRLARKTICFSKSEWLHDIVIGLFVNRYEFGLAV